MAGLSPFLADNDLVVTFFHYISITQHFSEPTHRLKGEDTLCLLLENVRMKGLLTFATLVGSR